MNFAKLSTAVMARFDLNRSTAGCPMFSRGSRKWCEYMTRAVLTSTRYSVNSAVVQMASGSGHHVQASAPAFFLGVPFL